MEPDEDRRQWEQRMLEGAQQIGPNQWIQYVENADDVRVGLHFMHYDKEGKLCIGGVTFDVPAAHAHGSQGVFWTVENEDPLTLSPSILCRSDGEHGFIREGKWVPA